jgi:serine phosphatase RsbU (regulator of sigma subunit)/pSer/pThr/pTyr-binding forkhead associated (FHA) protein
MPSLQVIKGANEGQVIPLDGDKYVLGRNPDCGIVIPITSVSREHAQIVRIQGRYFIEDKQSRNGTFVNNQAIATRTPLRNNDKIRICDFIAAFYDQQQPVQDVEDELEGESGGTTTVEATLSQPAMQLLETQPAEKLRVLLEISGNLGKTLELDKLLPKIVDSLFGLFRQADRCFLIQAEEGTGKLMPRVVKTRKPHEETNARYSRSLVRNCLETAKSFLSDDASRDDRVQLSQSVVDFRIRSVMIAPLVTAEGKAFGVIQLDTQDRGKKFTQEDLQLLSCVAVQASVAMENAKLHEDAMARERLKRDLELAHEVQMSFMPRSLPQVAGYEFAAHYEPALEVGGDYYDFVTLPGGRLALALGDVAGKGMPAALLVAKLSSDTRFSLLTEPDAGKAMGRLNDLLCEFIGRNDRFVTLALIVLEPAKHAATIASAGHPSPLLVRKGKPGYEEAMPTKAAGLPLGVAEGYVYESCQVSLQPGDSLLVFTDGIPESYSRNNTQFGEKGIQAAVRAAGGSGPKQLIESLVRAVQAHSAGRNPHDDVAVAGFGRVA